MTATFGATDIATNGTTPVDVVPDPGASNQSELLLITVWNRDSVDHTYTAQKVTGTAVDPMTLGTANIGTLKLGVIPVAGAVVTNGQKIQVKVNAALTTTESAVHASYFKIP